MAARDKMLRRIEDKRSEIAALEADLSKIEAQVRDARTYIQALEDALKMLPKETEADDVTLRPGTAIDKAREAILAAGRPLHIAEIVLATGKPNDAPNRVALSGSISAYVRKGQIFSRPAPNTFGLIGMHVSAASEIEDDAASILTPPSGFGEIDQTISDEDVPF